MLYKASGLRLEKPDLKDHIVLESISLCNYSVKNAYVSKIHYIFIIIYFFQNVFISIYLYLSGELVKMCVQHVQEVFGFFRFRTCQTSSAAWSRARVVKPIQMLSFNTGKQSTWPESEDKCQKTKGSRNPTREPVKKVYSKGFFFRFFRPMWSSNPIFGLVLLKSSLNTSVVCLRFWPELGRNRETPNLRDELKLSPRASCARMASVGSSSFKS